MTLIAKSGNSSVSALFVKKINNLQVKNRHQFKDCQLLRIQNGLPHSYCINVYIISTRIKGVKDKRLFFLQKMHQNLALFFWRKMAKNLALSLRKLHKKNLIGKNGCERKINPSANPVS